MRDGSLQQRFPNYQVAVAPALRMWRIDDNDEGSTWVIAVDEANALLEYSRHDDENFGERLWRDVEVEEVDPGEAITVGREECDGGPETKTAAEWCQSHGAGVLCSTWWQL